MTKSDRGGRATQSSRMFARATILVVDDQLFIRRYVTAQLDRLGYDSLTAPDGERALEMLSENPGIDLMMTDVVMPGMDGYTLADKARALRPKLKILMCSGSLDDSRFPKRAAPDLPFLGKPYRMRDLASQLRELLGDRSA